MGLRQKNKGGGIYVAVPAYYAHVHVVYMHMYVLMSVVYMYLCCGYRVVLENLAIDHNLQFLVRQMISAAMLSAFCTSDLHVCHWPLGRIELGHVQVLQPHGRYMYMYMCTCIACETEGILVLWLVLHAYIHSIMQPRV